MVDLQLDLVGQGASAVVVAVDLTVTEDRERLVETTLDRLGRIDVLVNNAGVSSLVKYVKTDWDEVGYQVDLNLVAPMHLTHLVLPHMLDRDSGKIINISTLAASMSMPYPVSYGTTKAGLEYFTKTLRKELGGTGVSASAVIPGGITNTGKSNSLEARAGRRFGPMLERGMMTPEKVAGFVMKAINTDKGEHVAAKGGSVLRTFPRLGEKLMGSAFTPMMEPAGRLDITTGRKVSDPTVEELVS